MAFVGLPRTAPRRRGLLRALRHPARRRHRLPTARRVVLARPWRAALPRFRDRRPQRRPPRNVLLPFGADRRRGARTPRGVPHPARPGTQPAGGSASAPAGDAGHPPGQERPSTPRTPGAVAPRSHRRDRTQRGGDSRQRDGHRHVDSGTGRRGARGRRRRRRTGTALDVDASEPARRGRPRHSTPAPAHPGRPDRPARPRRRDRPRALRRTGPTGNVLDSAAVPARRRDERVPPTC